METRFELTEENYRYLFENASDAMWVQDMRGYIVNINKACERLTGFTREELLGRNVRQFISGEYLELARKVYRKLISGEEIEQPYEQRLVRKNGSIRIMKMATSLVIVDGEIRGFQHVARDVTEEKRAEEMLSKIIDGSPIPAFVINKEHRITHWNTAVESLSGISGEEIIGTNGQWRAFYSSERPTMADLIVNGASMDKIEEYYHGKYKKSRLIEGAYEAEDFFPSLGETGTWLLFTASPIRGEDGEIIGAIETLQDITDERKMQENLHYYVQQITRAQEDERKRVARELHDESSPPLILLIHQIDRITTSTRRLSESMKERLEKLREQAVEALEGLRRCAQDLRPRIVDDLGLLPALEWMADNLEKDYGIKTKVEVKGNEYRLPDEVQLILFRIAQEALSNIRRHARAKKAWISLEFCAEKAVLRVKDDGEGFEVPSRIGDLTSTGRLGLAGMRERAQLINADLRIESAPGKGTTVTVEVPVEGS
jgi:PAS domain S-box-containing protein